MTRRSKKPTEADESQIEATQEEGTQDQATSTETEAAPTPAPETTPEPAVPVEVIPPSTPVEVIPPQPAPKAPDVTSVDALPISARAYVEETPGLVREARDILIRLYGTQRKTRAQWAEVAKSLGGKRK